MGTASCITCLSRAYLDSLHWSCPDTKIQRTLGLETNMLCVVWFIPGPHLFLIIRYYHPVQFFLQQPTKDRLDVTTPRTAGIQFQSLIRHQAPILSTWCTGHSNDPVTHTSFWITAASDQIQEWVVEKPSLQQGWTLQLPHFIVIIYTIFYYNPYLQPDPYYNPYLQLGYFTGHSVGGQQLGACCL